VSLSTIPKILRAAVATRDGGRCRYCGILQVGQVAVFHIDHVIPRSRGGDTVLDNLALQCPHCSLRKSNKIQAFDPDTGREAALFHPLRDRWEDHFALLRDGTLTGKSDTARATIDALQMNEPGAKSARLVQIIAGLLKV
jgi:hypothetical protein